MLSTLTVFSGFDTVQVHVFECKIAAHGGDEDNFGLLSSKIHVMDNHLQGWSTQISYMYIGSYVHDIQLSTAS